MIMLFKGLWQNSVLRISSQSKFLTDFLEIAVEWEKFIKFVRFELK